MHFKNIMSNKYVLYIVVLVALTNVVGYLAIQDYNSLVFFFVITFLSSYFSKNMTVNLLVAILGTNIIFANNRMIEGFKENQSSENQSSGSCVLKDNKTEPNPVCDGRKQNACSGVCKWTAGTETMGVPSSTPAVLKGKKDEDDNTDEVERVDYAKTVGDAYKNLQGMLGKGGIQNLSNDTKDLMKQQTELMETFKGLGPMIQQAGSMMKQLQTMPDMNNLQSMMKSLNGPNKK